MKGNRAPNYGIDAPLAGRNLLIVAALGGIAMIEGVADKVEVHTGDARKLPFDDASFNVVLSSMALHNIYNAGERQTAVREIARVLKSGGRVLIVDVRHTRQYAATLRDAGLDARCVQGIVSYLLTVLTFGWIH